MKEILIAVAAVATLMSCQSEPTEKEKLITQKLEDLNWYRDYYYSQGVMSPDSHKVILDIIRTPYDERTEAEDRILFRYNHYRDKLKEVNEEREFWILQQ